MRLVFGLFVGLLACGGTEPDYPPFDGPAPTVSDFSVSNRQAGAILRDSQGGTTIGRTDYTYVYFFTEGNSASQLSFAREWTWTRVDDLTWRVAVPGLTQDWSASLWHVADDSSNVRVYQCADRGPCARSKEPVLP